MRAIVQDRYGSADVLDLRDVEVPEVGDDDVLVQVHAAGVDPGVWHLMTGLPYAGAPRVRAAPAPQPRPRHGPRRCRRGGRARRHPVRAGRRGVRHRRGHLRRVRGGARGQARAQARATSPSSRPPPFPSPGRRRSRPYAEAGKVRPGQRVLVIGAGGGVGSFAVQLAKASGAHVTGVCSPTKLDLVRSIGADDVVDYTREDVADRGRRYDVIVDTAGNRSLSHLRRALAPTGTLVLVGGEAGNGKWLQGFDRQLRSLAAVAVRQRAVGAADVAGERGEPRGVEGTHRGRRGHAGHRQDLSAGRGGRRDPPHQGRPRAGQGRPHRSVAHTVRTACR